MAPLLFHKNYTPRTNQMTRTNSESSHPLQPEEVTGLGLEDSAVLSLLTEAGDWNLS